MSTRAPAVLAVSALALLAAATPASATDMTPLVTCVDQVDGGYVAHFGYRNDTGTTVTRSVAKSEGKNAWLNLVYDGPANDWTKVVDSTIDRGQPTTFQPGRHDDVFTVSFSGPQVTWALVGRWATATAQSVACERPTVTEPTPEPTPPSTDTAAPPVVAAAVPAPAATPVAVPAAAPAGTPAKRVCTSRRTLTIRLRERKGQKIRSARVLFRNKTIATSRRTRDGRVVAKIDFRKLPSGRFSVKIRAKLTNGKTKTYTRRYYTCKPKWGPKNKLGSKSAL